MLRFQIPGGWVEDVSNVREEGPAEAAPLPVVQSPPLPVLCNDSPVSFPELVKEPVHIPPQRKLQPPHKGRL